MVDYTKMAAKAYELVKANGRLITVNRVGVAPADPNKPWRGPSNNHSPLLASQTLWAVDAGMRPKDVGKTIEKKDMPEDWKQIWLVVPELGTPRLDSYDEVVDEGNTYNITAITVLKPGDTVIMYEIAARK